MQKLFRSTSIEQRPIFMNYVLAVGESFCPFVNPAEQKRVLFFSEYDFHRFRLEDFQAMVFYLGLMHTEFLRKERRRQGTRILHDLFCENAIFYIPPEIEIRGKDLFDWPHWLLKLLYTRFSLLFGKFWKGEQDTSRDGRAIPVPPDHFLSIRSAIKPTDARFFSLAPQLTDTYLNSCDDGTSVFFDVLVSVPSQVKEVEMIDQDQVRHDHFLRLLNSMLSTNFYEELKKWGMEQWKKQAK